MLENFWRVDFAPLVAAILSAICCCLPGNLLLARGQSMTTDAISHIVLPGMVLAFLFTGSLSFGVMFWGALLVSFPAILLIEYLGRFQNRDAVLGMVFCVFFALGVLLLEIFVDRRVHFDVRHVLFGSLESVYWQGLGEGAGGFFSAEVRRHVPPVIVNLLVLLAFQTAIWVLAYKEILAVHFDPTHARLHWGGRLGVTVIYYGLPVLSAMTIVMVFRMVGLILIVGMFIIPPLLASFFTKSLIARMRLSLLFAVLLCVSGYFFAVFLPVLLGGDISLNIGGSIVTLGAFLCFIMTLIKQFKQHLINKNVAT